MSFILEAESKLTDRYQTTVPEAIRRALRLGKHDRLHYAVCADGSVLLTRAGQTEEADPALGAFLAFLERDIATHPERLQTVDSGLLQRVQSLVGGVEVDLEAPLSADDE